MESLSVHLQPLFSAYSLDVVLQELEQVLPVAEARVTFWGNKVLVVKGYEGSVYIDSIWYKLAASQEDNPCVEQETLRVMILREKLKKLYAESERLLQTSGAFTRTMAFFVAT